MNLEKAIKCEMLVQDLNANDMARLFRVSRRTWDRWIADANSLSVWQLTVIAGKLETTATELLRKAGL